MKNVVRVCLLSELRLHPELERLGSQIERHCFDMKISFNSLCPLVHRVISIHPDGEIIGNLPAYRKAVARGIKKVKVCNLYLLALEDPAVITLRALTSLARRGYSDPLLLGLIYRAWANYEENFVPLRPALEIKQAQRDLYGMTLREHLHEDLSRRLGRSRRDLQRLASVLDAPRELQRLYRKGRVNLQVLERFLTLPAADQDDMMEALGNGESVKELIDDYGLKANRKQLRLESAMTAIARNLTDALNLLHEEVRGHTESVGPYARRLAQATEILAAPAEDLESAGKQARVERRAATRGRSQQGG